MKAKPFNAYQEGYHDGYRVGYLDALVGMPQSKIALTSPLPGYKEGYVQGYVAQQNGGKLP